MTKAQRDQVAKEIYAYVVNRVPGDLISDLFPDRLKLWEFLTGEMARLNLFDRHQALYHACSTASSKCSELFLRWLDFVRSVTCVSEHTPEILKVSGADTRTVITNAVYMRKQMSKTVEEISDASAGIPEGQPSGDTLLGTEHECFVIIERVETWFYRKSLVTGTNVNTVAGINFLCSEILDMRNAN